MTTRRARSLRFKLALWFVLVSFALQAILAGGVVFFRRELISRTLEDTLATACAAMVDNVLAAEVGWDPDAIHGLVPTGSDFLLYAVRDARGELLLTWNVRDASALPFTAREAIPAGPLGSTHIPIGREDAERLCGTRAPLRLTTVPFRRDGELFYFQAAAREEAVDRALGPFFDLVVVGVPVALVIATIAGWMIAGRAVSPMRHLSRAARDVSPGRMSERFDVPTTDDEVARLESELNSALERLEAGYRAQDQFVSNVSHELKTPIAVLLTQAQVARMGPADPERDRAFVANAEHLLQRLGKLVESFLLLARADLAEDRPSAPASVFDAVLGAVRSCSLAAEQRGVRIVPNLPHDVDPSELTTRGDVELVQTMIENLVYNAIRHSPSGGTVGVELSAGVNLVEVTVCDEGPGIPEEYLDSIFDRFVQVPRDDSHREGTGLGLAIAHNVARLHGGDIRVENVASGGCAFRVELPRSRTS